MNLPQPMTMLPGTPAEVSAAVAAEVLASLKTAQWVQDEPAEVICEKMGWGEKNRRKFYAMRKAKDVQPTRVVGCTPLYRLSDFTK